MNVRRSHVRGGLGLLVLVALLVLPVAAFANPPDTVDICHATGSHTNPYVSNHPAKDGDVSGHDGHNGQVWFLGIQEEWGDIIPAFEYVDAAGVIQQYPGQNLTAEGQAILDNGCKTPDPTPCDDNGNGHCPTPTNTSVPPTATDTPPRPTDVPPQQPPTGPDDGPINVAFVAATSLLGLITTTAGAVILRRRVHA